MHLDAPHMTPDEFRRVGHRVIDWLASYMERVESMPVRPSTEPGEVAAMLPDAPPESSEGWDAILADLDRIVVPNLMHWQHPGFLGYFPCNASGPAILGDLVSTGLGVQGMLWSTSPACTEIETVVLDWFADAIGLPSVFRSDAEGGESGGVILGTASEAALTAMIAARDATMHAHGATDPSRCTVYTSEQAHSSIMKAAGLCGIGRANVRTIPTGRSLALDPGALREVIQKDAASGMLPSYACATIGTTSTGAIDPLRAMGEITRAHDMWLHVDAAYAGSALVCPEHREMIEGVELADSFNFNPHKWLLTSFDCSLFWIRRRSDLLSAMAILPEYLRNAATDAGSVIDYRDWHIPLGRRFRALKLWFVLRHYGLAGLRAFIREHVRLAELLEGWIASDDRFVLCAPRCLSLLCFRLAAGDDATRTLMERVNASGEVFLTHTRVPDWGPTGEGDGAERYVIRVAIGATTVREDHIRRAWAIVSREADGVLGAGV
ncbi:MAG: aminotransferase class V-fold PLP-dependent enzyme [Planctomycetota bacterium]